MLVVDDGLLTVCDLLAVADMVDRKLDVLGQEVEGIAVHLIGDPSVEHKARSRYSAARVQEETGAVQVLSLTEEPEGVACGSPAVAVVLAVPVAGDDGMSLVMSDVHLADILRIDDVIGIENKISVKSFRVILLDLLQEEVQSIAFADVLVAVALVNDGASLPGDLCGPVVAVVCTDEDLYLLVGVVLVVDAVDQVADDELLVAGTDQESICILDDLALIDLLLFARDLVLY